MICQIPDEEPNSDDELWPKPNKRPGSPRALALRSRREAFGGRTFSGRGLHKKLASLTIAFPSRMAGSPGRLSISCFTTSGEASLIPDAGWRVEFDIDIHNQPRSLRALSSQTLAIQSRYSDESLVRGNNGYNLSGNRCLCSLGIEKARRHP